MSEPWVYSEVFLLFCLFGFDYAISRRQKKVLSGSGGGLISTGIVLLSISGSVTRKKLRSGSGTR